MPTFRATVELGGKTATGIEVPPEVVESPGRGRRVPRGGRRRRQCGRSIEEAKKPERRARRLAKTLDALRSG